MNLNFFVTGCRVATLESEDGVELQQPFGLARTPQVRGDHDALDGHQESVRQAELESIGYPAPDGPSPQ